MIEHCDPIGNCRGTVLCPCGCGACVVHCPNGSTWLQDNITLLETLLARREAWLEAGGETMAREIERIRKRARMATNRARQTGSSSRNYRRAG